MTDCLFCRIVQGELPATVVLDTDRVLAFRDISPQAPTHVVVVPKTHYDNAVELAAADPALMGELVAAAGQVAETDGRDSVRLVTNVGAEAGQTVFHVHLHVLGGRALGRLG
ncbi:histidine triad nucleotide-binding protein [Longispora sp. NPDC051575]|uniref:histidine triad nucleotide-binding protein n=1 Tax=Longispora sp. NPDC051575 TaxID=3154943 RepID=UPI00341B1042